MPVLPWLENCFYDIGSRYWLDCIFLGEIMIDDKAFVAFFNELIEASCGRRGCSVQQELPTDTLEEGWDGVEEEVGLPWGY